MGIEAIKISSREHIVHTAMAGFDFATLKVQMIFVSLFKAFQGGHGGKRCEQKKKTARGWGRG